MATLTDLKLDLAEFETLLKSSIRVTVQGCLIREIDRLRSEIKKLEAKAASANKGTSAPQQKQGYQENITKYAWDQSDKFMKLYLSLDSLSSITEENISSEFSDRSVTVKVQFAHKCSTLHIARLCEAISPKDSYVKKKSDYVLVMIKKADIGTTWAWVTEREKKAKETKENKPSLEDKGDPGAGLTSLLKNMYDDGDDEMKKQISKAFYESQMKQREGGMEGPDPMMGL